MAPAVDGQTSLNKNNVPGKRSLGDFRLPFSLGMLLTLAGAYFDAWWHIFRGRETFWTPAHIVLYSGVGIMMLSSVLLSFGFLHVSFTRLSVRTKTAFFSGLGMMLVSAPIDDWWHNTFGPDTGPWTPPHLLATAGFALLLAMAVGLFYRGSGRLTQASLIASVGLFVALLVTVTLIV